MLRKCAGYSPTLQSVGNIVRNQIRYSSYDTIIVGGGHNGLVSAAYLGKAGKKVLVLEKRNIIGGAAVTEELFPSFKYSRGSYVFSLFRPTIVEELELKRHGLKLFKRNPSSFTPLLDGRYLLLGSDMENNRKEIAKFSKKDAEKYEEYDEWLQKLVKVLNPYLDAPPLEITSNFKSIKSQIPTVYKLTKELLSLGKDIPALYELMTAPASKILDRWFESEPLKATLATDAVVGAMTSPQIPGSGYVLFHHIMGEAEGVPGSWAYVKGGMGALSECIAKSAIEHGAEIRTSITVDEIVIENDKAVGVKLQNGDIIRSKTVISNTSPQITFLKLLRNNHQLLPKEFLSHFNSLQCQSPVCKINVSLDRLPNFNSFPGPGPHHQTTIHMGSETSEDLHQAYIDAAVHKIPSNNPMIEMTIPSVLDNTLAPPGKHVASLFCQFIPYSPKGYEWNDETRKQLAHKIFSIVDQYAPGFSSSVLHADILTPPDLERVFGLHCGNISHISMTLDQVNIFFCSPLCTSTSLY